MSTSSRGTKLGPPTVSVVIPTYNRAHVVGRAIRSVLNQTYQDFEIIVVDDGSTDNTEEVVKSFNDPRIRYIRHEENRGGSAARNTGIRAARGAYIAFLDSDDEWLPEKLAKQVQKMTCSGDQVGFVYTGVKVIDAETGRCLVEKVPFLEGNVYSQLLEGAFIGTCSSVMVRKTAIEEVSGFDEQLVSRQDWDCWIRIAYSYNVSCIPECLVVRYTGLLQISSKLQRIAEGTVQLLEKHRANLDKRPRTFGKKLAELAMLQLAYNRKLGWATARRALKIYPCQPKLVGALLISLLGVRVYQRVFFFWKRRRGDVYVGKSSV